MPDAPLLYDDLTVRQHLELVALSHGVAGDGIDDRIDELLDRLGLGDREEFVPRELSRGMRQKAQLACALIRPAALLVLDEPVVGLDPPSQVLLYELLLEAKRAGTAVLLTTHQMGFADGLADRAVDARRGRGRRRGPVGRGARAGRGARVDLAVAAARRPRRLAGGARLVARAPARRRRSASASTSLYTIAISAAILGALAYGTAGSALAQVVTPAWLARSGRRSRSSRC